MASFLGGERKGQSLQRAWIFDLRTALRVSCLLDAIAMVFVAFGGVFGPGGGAGAWPSSRQPLRMYYCIAQVPVAFRREPAQGIRSIPGPHMASPVLKVCV